MSTQSINYELALELKNAGFPQLNHMLEWELDKQVLHGVGYHLTADDPDEVYESGQLINKARYTSIFGREWILSEDGLRNTVYIPTLSELIEACGEEFDNHYVGKNGNLFEIIVIDASTQEPMTQEVGKTPEEAVAYLYLSLNRDKIKGNGN